MEVAKNAHFEGTEILTIVSQITKISHPSKSVPKLMGFSPESSIRSRIND